MRIGDGGREEEGMGGKAEDRKRRNNLVEAEGEGNGNASDDDVGGKKNGTVGGLSSLLAGYDSPSEDESPESSGGATATATTNLSTFAASGDAPAANDAAVVSPPAPPPVSVVDRASGGRPAAASVVCIHFRRGRCRHGDSCRFLHPVGGTVPVPAADFGGGANSDRRRGQNGRSQSERDRERNRREDEMRMLGLAAPGGNNNRNSSGGGGKKSLDSTSLLHKLLRRDKERERRLTLQLLRYIVDCDHFRDDEDARASSSSRGEEGGADNIARDDATFEG